MTRIAALVIVLTASLVNGLSAQPVTFRRDVAPLFGRYCAECHHAGGPAPFDLLDYASARRHASQVVDALRRGVMPPWRAASAFGDFVGQPHPRADEIALMARWASDGAAEGDGPAPDSSVARGPWRQCRTGSDGRSALAGDEPVDPLQILQVGELDRDLAPSGTHLHADAGVEQLGEELLELEQAGGT